ncbi:MAG TPA: radical SAM/SPASM domain-containing protein [Thermoanaerobaculia bacterium]|nr:radical SAM/SPASM domain-containing protein [Thermoanaerobaculia bacterium]
MSENLLDRKREAIASFVEFADGGPSPRWPLEIYLEISNVCDLRCVMCTRFSAFNPARKQAIWDVDPGFLDASGAAETLRPLLERALVVHAFGYGEPTIHPDFPGFLSHLSQFEVLIDFFTNGMHLTDELARLLVDRAIHHLTVSFSGSTAAEYESVYQGGNFEKVLAGLDRVREAKRAAGKAFPGVRLNSVTFDHHVRSLDRFVELAAAHGVESVELTRLLEHTAVVPQLGGHAANLRSPEIRDAIGRGKEAAARLGIELALHPMIEAELALPEEGGAPGGPPDRLPLEEFPAAARALPVFPPSRENGPIASAVDLDRWGIDEIRRRLRVREYAQGEAPFYCLEPFKTFYLRRGGQVKTCCYMNDEAPGLGDIRRWSGEQIWSGAAYEVFRGAVRNGQYPMLACEHCLERRQAPGSHGVDQMLRDYASWHPKAKGRPFDERTIGNLATAWGSKIVARSFDRGSRAATAPGAGERVAKVLARLSEDPLWWSLVEGWVDHASAAGVAGWVYSPPFSDLRFPVTVWAGDRKLAEGIADMLRADLAEGEKGDGRYGFAFPMPLTEAEARAVRVELGNTGCVLERIPALQGERTSRPPADPVAAANDTR